MSLTFSSDTKILSIESSCDDCAAAVIDASGHVLAERVESQILLHSSYGGTVPELASREHLSRIAPVVAQVLSDAGIGSAEITHVAATFGPGLIGSLLVGYQFARGFAQGVGCQLIPIHHIEGHIYAGFTENGFPDAPFVALLASGGHSGLYVVRSDMSIQSVSQTRDDAAGEALDKIARMLGLPYPGGPSIEQAARDGRAGVFRFNPALRAKTELDYSFSGLKNAARLEVERLRATSGAGLDAQVISDLCYGVQETVVESLLDKAFLALGHNHIKALVLGGGVAANGMLRARAIERGEKESVAVFVPPKTRCTDNAVMIARAALRKLMSGEPIRRDQAVMATVSIEDRAAALDSTPAH